MNKKIILLALSLLVLSIIVGASTLAFADFGTSKNSHSQTVVTPDAPNAQMSTSTTAKEEAEPETDSGSKEEPALPPEGDEKHEPEISPDVTAKPEEKPEPEVTTEPENGKFPVINTPGSPSLDADEEEKPEETPEPEPEPEPEIDYAEKIVSIVKGEVGVKEKKYNNVKYNTWYYGRVVSASSSERPTYAWCITFISWCADQAGISTDVIPKMNNAETLRKFYADQGLYHAKKDYTPKVGDIIFYGSKTSNHAGIVVAVNGSSVTVVEGNASDRVKTITYKLTSSSIMGYATPNY